MLLIMHISERLRRLRNHAGLNQKQMAKAMGYKGQSSYYRYENESMINAKTFPLDFVRKLHKALDGKGIPPITYEELSTFLTDDDRKEFLRLVKDDNTNPESARGADFSGEVLQYTGERRSAAGLVAPAAPQLRIEEFEAMQMERHAAALYVVIEATDNAMQCEVYNDRCIRKGDRVLCNIASPIKTGDLVAVKLQDRPDIIIREYKETPGDNGIPVVALIPANAQYETITLDRYHHGRIIARVMLKIIYF